MHQDAMRMTEGSIPEKMLRFAAPLFLGNLFQQLYNTADALIVGNMLGSGALAAVSATGTLVFLIISLFVGISAGAGVLISRYFGSQDHEKLEKAVHTNVAFSLAAGGLMTIFGVLLTPTFLEWMDTPPDVQDQAADYIRIFFAGSLGLVLYNGLRGIMQAVGDGKNPLRYLVFCSCLNVVLDIAFIGLFHAGVEGAALATIISQFLSGLLCLRRLLHTDGPYRVELRKIRFDWPTLDLIVRYGLPSGIQNSVIAIANVVVQANINDFGTMAVAGCGAYSKIEGFAFLPITSFTISLTTFVGQNLGAREYQRAKRGAVFGLLCAMGAAELIGVLLYLTAPWVLQAFSRETEAIGFGVDKARICALFFCLLALSHGLAAVLRGAGKAVIPMISMLSFWCVVRVAFLHYMVPITKSINTVNWVYPLTWALSAVFLGLYYWRADWIHAFEKQNA
ncbi:MAG: MATE family efflux transporter [Oscillospiraceae bacterium]|nr:MATE family efflux transporter [Oscillospiraceae bacterium]